MAVEYKDRVKETSSSTGTGDFILAGAVAAFQSFDDAHGIAQEFYYAIESSAEWEVGIGELSDPTTLVRTTVLASSNADALVNFTGGTKTVFSTVAAEYFGPASVSGISEELAIAYAVSL